MKWKVSVQVCFLILVTACFAQAASTLTVIGNHPFHTPPLTSVGELQTMVQEKMGEVELGMEKAGLASVFPSLIEQLPLAEVKSVDYPNGVTFSWMLYKTNGKGQVKVAKDVTWGGEEPLPGFEFHVDHKGQRYTFAVPLACGNLALLDIGAIPVVAVPPVAKEVAPAPMVREEPPLAAAPTPEPEVSESIDSSPFRFVADTAYLHQFDPANFVVVRLGFEHQLNENFSYLVMLGGAPRVRGSDGESAALVDVIGQYSFASRMFVGLGVGGWITSGDEDIDAEDSDVDLIFNLGTRIYGESDEFNTSLFFEVRSAVDELDDFSEFGRVGVGLRFKF